VTSNIQQEIEQRMVGRGDTFLERFAEQLGAKAGTTAAFSQPVEREGVTVIGVAKVRWGVGGGAGTGRGQGQGEGAGSGGGGGVIVTPTGYIEIKNGAAQYHSIRPEGMESALALAIMALAGAMAIGMVLGGIRRLLRQ
jgi:uncharacterized spore protein YtfJ